MTTMIISEKFSLSKKERQEEGKDVRRKGENLREKEEGQDNFGHQGWGPKLTSASPGADARNGIGL